MAISTGAAIIGSSLIGAGTSALGARGANRQAAANLETARGSTDLANQQIHQATTRSMGRVPGAFDAYRGTYSPYQQMGQSGRGIYNTLADPDKAREAFRTDPGYQFALQEGINAIGSNASAGGQGYLSGNTLRELVGYGTGLADQQYGNWFARSQGLASDMAGYGARADDAVAGSHLGQADALNSLDMGAARAYNNNYMQYAGMATGTPYTNPWGGINDAVQGGIGNYMYAKGNNIPLWGDKKQPVK